MSTFPLIKLIALFDLAKKEGGMGNKFVDWGISSDPIVAGVFADAINSALWYWLTLKDVATISLTISIFDCR